MAGLTTQFGVTIANAAAVSDAFPIDGWNIVGIITPSTWTTADISFEVETTRGSGSYVKAVDNEGVLFKLTGIATTTAEYRLTGGGARDGTAGLSGGPVITGSGRARIVSTNTASEANVNQGAARSLIVIAVPT